MGNYDNKLGEWFKQVEAKEQELKAKKAGNPVIREEAKPSSVESVGVPRIAGMEIQGPAREAPMSVVATMETAEVVADASLATRVPEPAADGESAAKLFAEDEVPKVEDFFSFLNRSSEAPVVEEVEEHVFELPKDQGSLSLSEGTGEPRPIAAVPEAPAPAPVAQAQPELVMTPPPPVRVEAPKPIEAPQPVETKPVEAPQPRVEAQPASVDAQANWDRMPKHLQTLFGGTPSDEVAQNSYKAFKETREELIQRLLDPTISLEEAARILNVCPTTVRRYTNRGVLQHYRTAGNQRRFKLSDVLVFMDAGTRRGSAEPEA